MMCAMAAPVFSWAGDGPTACVAEHGSRTPQAAAAAMRLVAMGESGREHVLEALRRGSRTGALCAWALWQRPQPWARDALEALILGHDQVAGYWAAMALGTLADPESVPALAKALADERNAYWELSSGTNRMLTKKTVSGTARQVYAPGWMPNIRVACAGMRALGSIGGANAREVLRAALEDPQYLVRHAAAQALGQAGTQGEEALLRKLATHDPILIVRRAAKASLAGLGDAGTAAAPLPPALPRSIAFIRSRTRTESNLGFRDSYFFPKTPWYQGGENLYTLTPPTPDGEARNLTNLEKGAVQGPEVSFDGRRILFAMRRDARQDAFHIYEINVDGSGLRQLTFGGCNDVDPCYLPDGRIAFCSDRAGYREYYHQERSRVLYVMNGNGRNVEQITFNPNQDYEPFALHDGRLLYASYRFYAQDGSTGPLPTERFLQRIETVLRTVHPDGSNDQHAYGSMRGSFYTPLRPMPDSLQAQGWHPRGSHVGVSVSQAREMLDGRLLCVTPAGLTVVDPALGVTDCEEPLFPEVLNLAGGEETYIHSHEEMNPIGRYTSPYPLGNDWALVSHAPWYDVRREAYDLYLMDLRSKKKTLVYADSKGAIVDAVPLASRPRPRVVPRLRKRGAEEAGSLYCNSVYVSDVPYERRRARFVRIIEALPVSLSVNGNGNFRTRVLGTAPLYEDGSFYVEVPANTALRFELLDGNEDVVVHETAFNYVRPGERKGCIGCHEPRDAAPMNAQPQAVKHEPFRTFGRGRLVYQGSTRRPYNLMVR